MRLDHALGAGEHGADHRKVLAVRSHPRLHFCVVVVVMVVAAMMMDDEGVRVKGDVCTERCGGRGRVWERGSVVYLHMKENFSAQEIAPDTTAVMHTTARAYPSSYCTSALSTIGSQTLEDEFGDGSFGSRNIGVEAYLGGRVW